jgi:predicted SAM-dependent methyltransferase
MVIMEKIAVSVRSRKFLERQEFLERHRVLLVLAKIVVLFRDKYRLPVSVMKRPIAMKRYLATHHVRKLQLGAGYDILEGWLNTDILPIVRGVVYLDAKKPFPFEDGTFDYVFSEHLIEHLTYDDGMFMIRECYRVLKPGGRIRISTPDLQVLLGLYTPSKSEVQQKYIRWVIDMITLQKGRYSECFVVNYAFRKWGHQFLYDRTTLRNTMEEVGFVQVTSYRPGESDEAALKGIDFRGKSGGNDDMDYMTFETMVLEGGKPPL